MRYILSLIVFILLTITALPQSMLLLMDDGSNTLAPYPKIDDLASSYDEIGMSASLWEDQTGDWDLATGVAPTLLSDELNGYPVLYFDSDPSYLVKYTISLAQPITIYFVIKDYAWATVGDIFQFNVNLYVKKGGGQDNWYLYGGTNYEPIFAFAPGIYKVGCIVINGASSLSQVGATITTGNPGTTGITQVLLGGANPNISIACLYIHSTAHDLATRTEIINWLNTKYGVY